ncbi:MAG: hypothetical protein HY259_09120 [Chloroflexi bacterium]|nr:hypothetical protein [Chloroflexota bacterium]MBI3733601.1 hypothetical protein [Chloroflexota bacterium]
MALKKTDRCYYCGAPATSEEHAPPQSMFAGFPCNKIKVPSCKLHNIKKDDDAVINGLLIALKQPDLSVRPLHPDHQKALSLREKYFRLTRHQTTPTSLQIKRRNRTTETITIPYVQRKVNIPQWMILLTAALVYDASRQFDADLDWLDARSWGPTFFPSRTVGGLNIPDMARAALKNMPHEQHLNLLTWHRGWTASPIPYPATLYYFDANLSPTRPNIIFRHTFYDAIPWYVEFMGTPLARRELEAKLGLG